MFIVKSPEHMFNLCHVREIHTEVVDADNATLYVVYPDNTRKDFATEDSDLIYNALIDIAHSLDQGKSFWDWDSYVSG